MGSCQSHTNKDNNHRPEVNLLVMGFSRVGKTSIIKKLKGINSASVTTIGLSIERMEYNGKMINFYDVGGQRRIKTIKKLINEHIDGVVCVVDSNDVAGWQDVHEDLFRVLGFKELKDAYLLVYANKQDLPSALKPAQVSNKLHLNEITTHPWNIVGSSAVNGEGIHEGLDWLMLQINKVNPPAK